MGAGSNSGRIDGDHGTVYHSLVEGAHDQNRAAMGWCADGVPRPFTSQFIAGNGDHARASELDANSLSARILLSFGPCFSSPCHSPCVWGRSAGRVSVPECLYPRLLCELSGNGYAYL